MSFPASYTDCRAFISDSGSGTISEVTIISHNKEYMTISVRGSFRETTGNEFGTVLILTEEGSVHEFRGRIRRSAIDATHSEIALFKGHEKEDRASKRYTLNTVAVVENLITPTGKQPLTMAVEIVLTNLSTVGVSFKAEPKSFALDTVVEIKLKANASISAMQGRVVRIRNIDATSAEYGCTLVAAY